MKKISQKVYEKFKEEPISKLVGIDNRNLNSLMLEVYDERSKKIESFKLLDKYIENYEFFGPSQNDFRKINKFNSVFLDNLPMNFQSIELSPIIPFGSNTSITKLSQKNILTTIKNSEICSDATTSLTFEACKRIREMRKNGNMNGEVNLATIKKVLRMQRFDKTKGYLQHFGQFAIITSGRKSNNFEYNKIEEHIAFWTRILLKYKTFGFSLGNLKVGICHINIIEHFIENNFIKRDIVNENSFNDYDLFKETNVNLPSKIIAYEEFSEEQIKKYKLHELKNYIDNLSNIIKKLSFEFKEVDFYIEMDRKGGLGYYIGYCFHIYSEENNCIVPLCDGGNPDWNSKILRDNKETSIVSGIGSELLLNIYGNNFENFYEDCGNKFI